MFEFLLEEPQLDASRERIERLVDASEDSVRVYRFCADCGSKLRIFGRGEVTEDPPTYIV